MFLKSIWRAFGRREECPADKEEEGVVVKMAEVFDRRRFDEPPWLLVAFARGGPLPSAAVLLADHRVPQCGDIRSTYGRVFRLSSRSVRFVSERHADIMLHWRREGERGPEDRRPVLGYPVPWA